MKNKRISKILGVGLTLVMTLALVAGFALPAAANPGVVEWSTISTPSETDNVIVPGSDIFDYAVSPDGDTVYAIGAITEADDTSAGPIGLTGSFAFINAGSVTGTAVSSALATVSGTLYGEACYLGGDFTAILPVSSITGLTTNGTAALTGTITYGSPTVANDDVLKFSGNFHGNVTAPAGTTITATTIAPATICVNSFIVTSFISGVVNVSGSGLFTEPRVWKSDDSGVTWSDITSTVQDAASMPGPFTTLCSYAGVAVAPDDGEWLVIAGQMYHPNLHKDAGPGTEGWDTPAVVASKDGGTSFSYAGDMVDTANSTWMGTILDVAVSPEMDGIHNVAVAGQNDSLTVPWNGTVYRLQAGTWLTGAWDDTSFYDGWDNGVVGTTRGVNTVAFSPNFDVDISIVCMGVNEYATGQPYIQSGLWETAGTWNDLAEFPTAIEIKDGSDTLVLAVASRNMGLALPADYDGTDSGSRNIYLYIDAWNATTLLVGGYVFMVENDAVSPRCGPPGDPLLASIAVHGDADSCKAMVGEYMKWDNDTHEPLNFECCEGVRVWNTVELDYCCPDWDGACKNPSGPYMAQVAYTPDGDKAYATTRGEPDPYLNSWLWGANDRLGGLCDESAFSVSLDDGTSWNQTGIIDTDIDFISDVAVCPDCEVTYISTINNMEGITCCTDLPIYQVCECDSVWRSYDDGDTWERIYHGEFSDTGSDLVNAAAQDPILLRLPVDTTEECCTLYMGDYGTTNLYYTRDCGQCWTKPPRTKVVIQDIAVETESIVYVLDTTGKVSKSTSYGRRPTDAVNSDVGSGHTIAVMPDGNVLVGGVAGLKVGYSDDGAETFSLTDKLPSNASGPVHVSYAPLCDDIIFATVSGVGIYRGHLDTDAWDDLNATPTEVDLGIGTGTIPLDIDYYGIVLGRSDGTLYAPYTVTTGAVVPGVMSAIGTASEGGGTATFNVPITPGIGTFLNSEPLVPGMFPPVTLTAVSTNRAVGTINVMGMTSMAMGSITLDLTFTPDPGFTIGATVGPPGVMSAVVATGVTPVAATGAARNLTPCETACCGADTWDYLHAGLTGDESFNTEPSALRICGCISMASSSVLYAIDNEAYAIADGSDGTVWVYEDCLAKVAPDLMMPSDGKDIPADPCECYNIPITLGWSYNTDCPACNYDIQVASDDGFTEVVNTQIELAGGDDMDLYAPPDAESPAYLIPRGAIDCEMTYWWRVRVSKAASGELIKSPWSVARSFTIGAGPGAAISLISPADGASANIPVTNLPFTWSGVVNATNYVFILSANEDLSSPLATKNTTTTVNTYTGTLEIGTPYYWQVKALKGTSVLSISDIGSFTILAGPPAPVEITPAPAAPVINIPPAQQISPTWIYAIIGIGAALAVVVIVLIVRTRRP